MGGGPGTGGMPDGGARLRSYAGLACAVGFALLVVASSLLSRRIEFLGSGFTELWPAGGIPIAWLMIRGVGVRSVDTVLLLLACFAANLIAGGAPDLSVLFAVANVVQCWAGILLLRRWCGHLWGFGGRRPLARPGDVAYLGLALAIAAAVGVVLGSVGAPLLPGFDGTLDPVASGLWFGRNLASSMLVVALTVMVGSRVASPSPRPPLLGRDGGLFELMAAVLCTIGMYALAFSLDDLPLAFPLLAATVWFGARFSTLLTAAHSFVVGLATALLTLGDVGPFAMVGDSDVGFMIAQFYIATIAVTGLALATGRDERQALADELRRAEEDSAYEETMRAAVIGAMIEGVIVVDEEGDLLVHNAAAARLLGFDEGVATDSHFSVRKWTLDGAPMPAQERPTTRALRGETVESEPVLVRVDGAGERILTVSAVPLPRDEVRDRARAMVLLRDSTTEHAHREELAAFAGVVAHDLRNPLAAIDGWAEMIAEELDVGRLDPQLAREFVLRVRNSSQRMHDLIRDLLDHATSTSRDLDVGRVDVAALAAEIAAGRHAGDAVTVGPVPAVLGDPVLIRQVLDNLIGNAIKYVVPGEQPRIIVRGCLGDARLVTIDVVDHGIGVPEEERKQIFGEFHRAHHRGYEGSGLGLSIVRRIVTRHGGTIEALPNPAGMGSVFRFTLPAHDV